MFILFSGELTVSAENGRPIATITPVTTVGEMGIITGQPRTATVSAALESEAFVINRNKFEQLVREDENMGVKIYKDVSHSLCNKIINDNVRYRDYHKLKTTDERTLSDYHNQIRRLKALLVERASMSEEQIDAEIK